MNILLVHCAILCNRYSKQDCPLPLLFYCRVCWWYCKKRRIINIPILNIKPTLIQLILITQYRINWDHHEHLCSQVKSSQVCEILFSVSVALLVCIDNIALFNYSISLRIIFGSFTREMDILVYVCTIVHPSGSTRIYEIINESDTPFNKQFSCLRKCLWAEGEHFYFVWICMSFFFLSTIINIDHFKMYSCVLTNILNGTHYTMMDQRI